MAELNAGYCIEETLTQLVLTLSDAAVTCIRSLTGMGLWTEKNTPAAKAKPSEPTSAMFTQDCFTNSKVGASHLDKYMEVMRQMYDRLATDDSVLVDPEGYVVLPGKNGQCQKCLGSASSCHVKFLDFFFEKTYV